MEARQTSRKSRREDFSRELIESQEAERKRIAGELHDSLEQDLLVIRNHATLALREVRPDSPLITSIKEILAASANALEEVRTIAANLRPHQLDRLGLHRALTAMCRNLSAASGMNISSELDEVPGLLPPPFETHLYRIVQESLNNILKHSRASEVRVAIKRHRTRVSLCIRDDGCGFGALSRSGGFGLRNIEERAKIMGGSLSLRSKIGKGTTVRVFVPYHRSERL